jgi:hypothetical protein
MDDRLEPGIRVLLGSSIAIGPGKAALLEAIGETGSIAAAGRRVGMSYRRAWVLAKTMSACFREPLIEAAKGWHRRRRCPAHCDGARGSGALSDDGGPCGVPRAPVLGRIPWPFLDWDSRWEGCAELSFGVYWVSLMRVNRSTGSRLARPGRSDPPRRRARLPSL